MNLTTIILIFLVLNLIIGRPTGLMRLLFADPLAFLLLAIPLLYSIIIHELAHGWIANKMGDSTAKWLGRLSFNPMKHLEPVGTLMLLTFGFGWAKPVPVNFNNLHPFRKGMLFVSAAGIVANFLLAFISLFILQVLHFSGLISLILQTLAGINSMLAAFNLIPIPPLDGSKILMSVGPPRLQYSIAELEPYGMFIIIGMLFLGVLDYLSIPFYWLIESLIRILLP